MDLKLLGEDIVKVFSEFKLNSKFIVVNNNIIFNVDFLIEVVTGFLNLESKFFAKTLKDLFPGFHQKYQLSLLFSSKPQLYFVVSPEYYEEVFQDCYDLAEQIRNLND